MVLLGAACGPTLSVLGRVRLLRMPWDMAVQGEPEVTRTVPSGLIAVCAASFGKFDAEPLAVDVKDDDAAMCVWRAIAFGSVS